MVALLAAIRISVISDGACAKRSRSPLNTAVGSASDEMAPRHHSAAPRETPVPSMANRSSHVTGTLSSSALSARSITVMHALKRRERRARLSLWSRRRSLATT